MIRKSIKIVTVEDMDRGQCSHCGRVYATGDEMREDGPSCIDIAGCEMRRAKLVDFENLAEKTVSFDGERIDCLPLCGLETSFAAPLNMKVGMLINILRFTRQVYEAGLRDGIFHSSQLVERKTDA